MGKKKKGNTLLRSSNFSLNGNEFSSLQDDIIQHFQLLKESNGLVIGFNAVLRSVQKNSLCAILYVSRNGVSAMYHALSMMCKGKDALFLQIQDINSNVFCSKIPNSTTYGIKKSVIDQPQFSKLLEKINVAKTSWKHQKQKAVVNIGLKSEELSVENQSSYEDTTSKSPSNKELGVESQRLCKDITKENTPSIKSEMNCIIHAKHKISKQKYTGKDGMLNFQEVDFPNYKNRVNQISISIA